MSSIQLLVGLGNPGKAYAETRHNAGAWFIENIADELETPLRNMTKYHGQYAQGELDDHPFHLLIPTTYMNLSGQSVRACAKFYKIPSSHIIVAHDDIDLPVGTIKIKFDGGDGGHNGLKDIIRHLDTKQFYRLRIGVGRPTQSDDTVDYVLQKPSKSERKIIDESLIEARDVLPLILAGEIQKAMQKLHT